MLQNRFQHIPVFSLTLASAKDSQVSTHKHTQHMHTHINSLLPSFSDVINFQPSLSPIFPFKNNL